LGNRRVKTVSLRLEILRLLAIHDPEGLNGYALGKALNVSNGSLYPALARVLAAGEARVEAETAPRNGQETKRYFLTDVGKAAGRAGSGSPKAAPRRTMVSAAVATRPRSRLRQAGPIPEMP